MRIVVLDGYTLNPGDLSWSELTSLGECDIWDRTPAKETVSRSQSADIILTNKTILNAEIIKQLSNLRYISVLATGYNVVDLKTAAYNGIPVSNVPEYSTQSVSQMVFAHILNFCHRLAEHSADAKQGGWSTSKDFSYWNSPQMELAGKTMGIVGLGRIGSSVASIALSFGMKALAFRPSGRPSEIPGIRLCDIDTLFSQSDFISLHCPLTGQNREFVNKQLLSLMKPDAFLINTSRGPLIDETALANALNREQIAGAGLDVLSQEPPNPDNPLLTAKNCSITPHIAWATKEARQRLLRISINNVKSFLAGHPVNVVNNV